MTQNKVAHRKSETQTDWSELWIETASPFTLTHPLTYIRLKINWVPVPPCCSPIWFITIKKPTENHTRWLFPSFEAVGRIGVRSFKASSLTTSSQQKVTRVTRTGPTHPWTRWVSNRCPMTQTMEPSKKLREVISFGLDWCLRKMNIFGSFV